MPRFGDAAVLRTSVLLSELHAGALGAERFRSGEYPVEMVVEQ